MEKILNTEETIEANLPASIAELGDMQLALVGGGIGETVL